MSVPVSVEVADETYLRANFAVIRTLPQVTHFTRHECEALAIIYSKFLNEFEVKRELMDRNQFRAFLHETFQITDDLLIDRAFLYIEKGVTPPFVSVDTFIKTLSLLLRGTLNEKMRYCFYVYDLGNNGKLQRNDIMKLTGKYFISEKAEDVEVVLKDFCDVMVRKFDVDGDGEISYEDFSTTVRDKRELLQCFGRILPDVLCTIEFMKTFTDDMPA